jgi:dipeptidase
MNRRIKRLFVLTVLAIAMLLSSNVFGCFGVIVGKDASVDGSILVGHDEQNGMNRFINFRKIPRLKHKKGEMIDLLNGGKIAQVPETYSYLWSENPGVEAGDTYMNEYGVMIASDGCPGREKASIEELEKDGQIKDGGLYYMFRRLIIERAETAREAVKIAGELIDEMGYASSRTYIIADRDEAWIMCVTKGKHWVAKRVPDDKVVILPNVFIIGEVNLEDKANFMGSQDLIEYAVKKGWYDPKSEKPFRFDEAYSPERKVLLDPRQWAGQCIVTKSYIEKTPDRRLPFAVTPAQKMTIADILPVLRFHSNDPKKAKKIRESGKFSVKGLDMGGICAPVTQEAAVFQLRNALPVEIGCVYWRISAEPCANVLTPWYLGILKTPKNYYESDDLTKILTVKHHFSEADNPQPGKDKAWTAYKNLQDKVDSNRSKYADKILKKWQTVEQSFYEEQPEIDRKALDFFDAGYSQGAFEYLTKYCHNTAEKAEKMTKDLTLKLQ